MAAPYDLNDDSVVVVIGSGAGGGTLGAELALKGVDTVILEAGGRHEIEDFQNDEWGSFRPDLLARHAHHVGKLARGEGFLRPPGLDREGGRRLHRPLGRRLAALPGARVQGEDASTATSPGANLLDWPIDLAEMEPWYAKAEDRMGVTRTHGIPGLPGNNNFKVFEAGAKKLGYKEVHTGRMAINSQPRDGRGSCQQIGFCFQGCKSGAKWSTLYVEIPKGEATGKLEVRPNSQVLRIEHDDSGKVTGVVYADKDGKQQRQKARVVAVAGNSIESPRLLLNSRLDHVPGRAGQFLGPGRQELHAAHDRLGLRDLRQAGAHVSRHDHGRHHPGRSEARSVARLRRRLRAGDAVARPAVHGRLPRSRRLGPRFRLRPGQVRPTWRACGSSARTCRRRRTA